MFSRQLALLKAFGYQTVTAEEYAKAKLGLPCHLPAKPFLLTFDDGSSTVFSEALPILKRHGFCAVLFMVSSRMGQTALWDGEGSDSGHRQLTSEELRALSQEGWGIGSHGATHARLTAMDQQALKRELEESKRTLESVLERSVDWFAYPYGVFDQGVRQAAARAGYRLAFATEMGDGFPLSIPRRVIKGRAGMFNFLRRLMQARRLARQ